MIGKCSGGHTFRIRNQLERDEQEAPHCDASQPPQTAATAEDPQALRRVKAILNSSSYRRGDNDIDFLARDGVRDVRLQIDYLKPELLLEEHEIQQTIMAFGGTRICEPAAARRKVEAL
jgi:hypothetical protein